MMAALAERFTVIVGDYDEALGNLEGVLAHVTNTKPATALGVVILNNLIVALVSTLEETIREIFTEYLTILEQSFNTHGWLRVELQRANLDCGIRELGNFKNDPKFDGAVAVLRNLVKCLDNEIGYTLFKDQLTYNKGNFRSSQLTDVAKNAGVMKIWNCVSDSPDVEAYIGEPNLETRAQRFVAAWNEIFTERDLIVHNISKASGWGDSRIREAMKLSRLVIVRIANCLVDDLNSLIAKRDQRLSSSTVETA